MSKVLDDIGIERNRQDSKWGVQDHPDGAFLSAGAMSAIREAAQMSCALDVKFSTVNWVNILDEEVAEAFEQAALKNDEALREELVQVAAVAVAWIECIDRRTK